MAGRSGGNAGCKAGEGGVSFFAPVTICLHSECIYQAVSDPAWTVGGGGGGGAESGRAEPSRGEHGKGAPLLPSQGVWGVL